MRETRYRTFWQRFFAGMIDGIVMFPLGVIQALVLKPENPRVLVATWLVLHSIFTLAYSILLHARFGQTLGKMATRVKVRDVSETRNITLRQSVVRDSPRIAFAVVGLLYACPRVMAYGYSKTLYQDTFFGSLLIWGSMLWFFVEVLTMLTNKKRRALHDWIAGTVVTRSSQR